MAKGYSLLGRALSRQGVDTAFFIMGGPINDARQGACMAEGIRAIDVRHEQAAAMMAQAYARVRSRPGVCMGASGPGTINLTTGLANALIDCAPVVAFGGASPIGALRHRLVPGDRPGRRSCGRSPSGRNGCYEPRAHSRNTSIWPSAARCRASPVRSISTCPGDVLYGDVDEDEGALAAPRRATRVAARRGARRRRVARRHRHAARSAAPDRAHGQRHPVVGARRRRCKRFVDATGIPFYTTPQGRGVIPEDHPFFFGHARSTAFKEADLVLVVGTRLNYVFSYGKPPRFSAATRRSCASTSIPDEIDGSERVDIGIVGDARTVLEQLTRGARAA